MKVLNNILKMEMSNIHLLKPSKNVRMKELFLWFFIFGIMVLYGGHITDPNKKNADNREFFILCIWTFSCCGNIRLRD